MFETLIAVFNTVLYRPIFNILVLIYNYLPGNDFGIAIIVLTLVIRLVLYPSSVKAIRSQKAIRAIQPKIKEIQEKHKDDKEKQAKETMKLYKKEQVNPFSGCLPILIQLPILIALFRVLKGGLGAEQFSNLYNFVSIPRHINPSFLGLIDLTESNIFIALFAGVFQFIQTKMITPKFKKKSQTQKSGFGQIMQKQMVYFFPVLTVIILLRLPSAIGLYWVTSSLFAVIQQYIIFKKKIPEQKS